MYCYITDDLVMYYIVQSYYYHICYTSGTTLYIDNQYCCFFYIVLNGGQWSVGFVLDSNALSVIKAVYDERRPQKKSEKDEREESLQKKELQSNYRKELLVAQEIIKSLQERLLDIESQQGRIDR